MKFRSQFCKISVKSTIYSYVNVSIVNWEDKYGWPEKKMFNISFKWNNICTIEQAYAHIKQAVQIINCNQVNYSNNITWIQTKASQVNTKLLNCSITAASWFFSINIMNYLFRRQCNFDLSNYSNVNLTTPDQTGGIYIIITQDMYSTFKNVW